MAKVVSLPLEAAVADPPMLHGCRRIQHGLDDAPLRHAIPDVPEGEAEWVANVERPGGLDKGRNFHHLGDRKRAETGVIEGALKQSHGLLTNRSGRCEQHQVNAIR